MHGICSFLHLHFDWVVLQFDLINAFNLEQSVSYLQKLYAMEDNVSQFITYTWYLEEPELYYSYYKSQQVCFHLVSEQRSPTRCPLRRSIIHLNPLLELLYNTTIRYVFSPTNDGFIGALFHSCILPYE